MQPYLLVLSHQTAFNNPYQPSSQPAAGCRSAMAEEYEQMEVDDQQGSEGDEEAFEAADEAEEEEQQDDESKDSEELAEVRCWAAAAVPRPPNPRSRHQHRSACAASLQDDAVEVAKAEKERLKQQQQHKKQLIEKMRAEQNAMAEDGEVRGQKGGTQSQRSSSNSNSSPGSCHSSAAAATPTTDIKVCSATPRVLCCVRDPWPTLLLLPLLHTGRAHTEPPAVPAAPGRDLPALCTSRSTGEEGQKVGWCWWWSGGWAGASGHAAATC